MVPADDLTPKGTDIGINIYIDRALAGGWGKGERLYMQGPVEAGRAEPGLPVAADARAALSRRHRGDQRPLPQDLRQDRSTGSMTAQREECCVGALDRQDQASTTDCRARVFWTTLYQTVMEGMFSDPIYGGNRNKAGWRLIGFPGVDRGASRERREISRQEISRRPGRHLGHELRRDDHGHQTEGSRCRHRRAGLDRRHSREGTGRGRPEGGRARARRDAHDATTTMRCPTSATSCATCVRHDLMQNTARDTLTVRNNPTQEALPMRRLGSFLPGEVVGGSGVHWSGHTWRWTDMEFKVRSIYEERYGKNFIPGRHDDPGLGHHLRRARALLRQVRIHRGGLGQGRQHRRARSSPAAIRSKRRARATIRCRRSSRPASPARAIFDQRRRGDNGCHPFPRPTVGERLAAPIPIRTERKFRRVPVLRLLSSNSRN